MSLINKMLQDLDARGGGSPAASGAAAEVRAVAPPSRSRSAYLAAGLGAAALAAAGAGYLAWQHFRAPSSASATAVTSASGSVTPAASRPAAANPSSRAIIDATAARTSALPASSAATPTPSASVADVSRAPDGLNLTRAPNVDRAKNAAKAFADTAHGLSANSARADDATVGGGAAKAAADRLRGAEKQRTSADKPPVARGTAAVAAARGAEADAGSSLSSQQRAENEYRRGLQALHDARVSDAIVSLEQAVFLYPRHEAARQTLIGLLVERKQYPEAVRHLQFAVGLDPRQSNMVMLLARLQGEQGGPAIETLQRGLQYANGNADYRALLGGLLQRAQRHKEAIDQYSAAVQMQPGQGVWWMGLGISLQAEQRKAEARDAFVRARDSGRLSAELQSFVERKLQQLAAQ
ncbi:hypothetical protein ACHMW6_14790 [Pseudoduganella sp. UC29_106]|uniref:hypothetical protein n=1 Tax=Pseudoduganella sp. UC29_106 TaxID=3374553 RepID=UPI003756BFC0